LGIYSVTFQAKEMGGGEPNVYPLSFLFAFKVVVSHWVTFFESAKNDVKFAFLQQPKKTQALKSENNQIFFSRSCKR